MDLRELRSWGNLPSALEELAFVPVPPQRMTECAKEKRFHLLHVAPIYVIDREVFDFLPEVSLTFVGLDPAPNIAFSSSCSPTIQWIVVSVVQNVDSSHFWQLVKLFDWPPFRVHVD